MMDYFRWLAFVKLIGFFKDGAFMLLIAVNTIFVGILSIVFWPAGLTLAILSTLFWTFCAFLFAQRAWRANRAEYQKFRDKAT
jgi:hypothetical protein